MDPKEYISSGKLEDYVLGIGSAETLLEVECMARVFPEVKEELKALQSAIEKDILGNQTAPPAQLKKRIFDTLDFVPQPESVPLAPVMTKSTDPSWVRLIPLMLILLLAVAGILSYLKFKQVSNELDTFKSEQLELNKTIEELNRHLELRNNELRVIRDPQTAAVILKGTPLSPASLAKVYWDQRNEEVYLEVHQLPVPPTGKQYQLWGIVGGKPVDLGIFDIPSPEDSILIKMKEVNNATTFAITLEPAGGNPGPTLDQMYVAGNVALN